MRPYLLLASLLLLLSACSGASAAASDTAHPMARLLGADVQQRYLPQGMGDEASIRRAYEEGILRSPDFPSLEVSGDQAFIFFGQFARSRMGPTFNTLTVCHAADGFRLLVGGGSRESCVARPDAGMRFIRQPDGALVCEPCAALNLPHRWERHDRNTE